MNFKAGKYVFFAEGIQKSLHFAQLYISSTINIRLHGNTLLLFVIVGITRLHPAPAFLYIFPASSCVRVEREHTSSGGEKKRKLIKAPVNTLKTD